MKQCTGCNLVKPLSEFDNQKRNPSKLYAWCRECMADTHASRALASRKRVDYRHEIAEMRAKAKAMRKFTPDQCVTLKAAHEAGTTKKALAKQYGCSESAIANAIKGYRG